MISFDACRDYRSFLFLDFIPRLLFIFYPSDNKETIIHTSDFVFTSRVFYDL